MTQKELEARLEAVTALTADANAQLAALVEDLEDLDPGKPYLALKKVNRRLASTLEDLLAWQNMLTWKQNQLQP